MADPIRGTHKAMNAALLRVLEMDRNLTDGIVTAPAFPESDDPEEFMAENPRPKEDRKRDYLVVRRDPLLISQMNAEQSARWKLPKHKPIARNVVKYFLEGEQEFNASD